MRAARLTKIPHAPGAVRAAEAESAAQPAVDALMMGAILLLFMVAFTYFYALERDQALAGAHARVPLAPPDGK